MYMELNTLSHNARRERIFGNVERVSEGCCFPTGLGTSSLRVFRFSRTAAHAPFCIINGTEFANINTNLLGIHDMLKCIIIPAMRCLRKLLRPIYDFRTLARMNSASDDTYSIRHVIRSVVQHRALSAIDLERSKYKGSQTYGLFFHYIFIHFYFRS